MKSTGLKRTRIPSLLANSAQGHYKLWKSVIGDKLMSTGKNCVCVACNPSNEEAKEWRDERTRRREKTPKERGEKAGADEHRSWEKKHINAFFSEIDNFWRAWNTFSLEPAKLTCKWLNNGNQPNLIRKRVLKSLWYQMTIEPRRPLLIHNVVRKQVTDV